MLEGLRFRLRGDSLGSSRCHQVAISNKPRVFMYIERSCLEYEVLRIESSVFAVRAYKLQHEKPQQNQKSLLYHMLQHDRAQLRSLAK